MHTGVKQFMCLSLALFASVAVANPYGQAAPAYGAAPASSSGYGGGAGASAGSVQQISLAGLSNFVNIDAIERYLNAPAPAARGSGSASYSHAKYVVSASAPSAGPVISSSYSAAPAPAASSGGYGASAGPALFVNEAPAISYAAPAPAASYGGSSSGHGGNAPAAPRYTVLPVTITQLNAGKTSYKTYRTPLQYSTVTLPVAASGPVANLYVPENAGHGSSGFGSAGSSYGGSSASY